MSGSMVDSNDGDSSFEDQFSTVTSLTESSSTKGVNLQIVYENGKSEKICYSGLMKHLSPLPPEKLPPSRGSRPLMKRADNAVPRTRRARKGKKRARARNVPAHQSESSSAARGITTADGSKKCKVQHSCG